MNWYFKTAIAVAVLAAIGAGGCYGYGKLKSDKKPSYKLGEVKRGDLVSTINATGTLEPEELVDVGAQVTGQILGFGKDFAGKPVDYGSNIKAGDVLTSIDDTTYSAEVKSATATVKQAEAALANSKADINQYKAKLNLARADLERAEVLKNGTMSKADYDIFKSAFDVATANLEVGGTKVLAAEASLTAAQATLEKAQRNLSYCTIRSPVDGVVIDRRVNIGQTVVSSMSTSSLFLIAKDIRRMQVWVAVNEADIGRILPGQTANFTVDAFPGEKFPGKVSKTRLNASMSQNVVTYTVEVLADNSKGRLLPYLTANVVFEVERLSNALLVPNAALRWSPKTFGDAIAGDSLKDANASLWTLEGSKLKSYGVKTITTDGAMTAINAPEAVKEGMPIVLGQLSANAAAGATQTNNPFIPKFRGGQQKKQGPPPPP